ncbi:hypothetical protein HPP92_001291 [Vanilla planifolia]|uniref:Uncharacterized protein n=1 Tax=Vanilla planifolia TaxID=51239 RepID=A0A835VHU8_VANPL|nr:hypothetical protein HPP92_001291 [Vanilla planifolia]
MGLLPRGLLPCDLTVAAGADLAPRHHQLQAPQVRSLVPINKPPNSPLSPPPPQPFPSSFPLPPPLARKSDPAILTLPIAYMLFILLSAFSPVAATYCCYVFGHRRLLHRSMTITAEQRKLACIREEAYNGIVVEASNGKGVVGRDGNRDERGADDTEHELQLVAPEADCRGDGALVDVGAHPCHHVGASGGARRPAATVAPEAENISSPESEPPGRCQGRLPGRDWGTASSSISRTVPPSPRASVCNRFRLPSALVKTKLMGLDVLCCR